MIIFDIDGVVADIHPFFMKDLCEYVNCAPYQVDVTTHNIKLPYHDLPEELIFHIAVQTTVKYVDEIKPHDGAIEFLHACYNITKKPVQFLTARTGYDVAEATHYWLNKHLNVPYFVHFNSNKKEFLLKNKEFTIIFEDRFNTVNELDFMQKVFLFNREWNIGRIAKPFVHRIDTFNEAYPFIFKTKNCSLF